MPDSLDEDSRSDKEARLTFILHHGILRFGLPMSVCVALALYGGAYRLTLWGLFSPLFLIYFGIAFVCVGLIGGYSWGARLWRQDHEDESN